MEEEKKKGLNNSTIALMVVVAFFYDVLQFVLSYILMGWIAMPIFYLHFWLWFRIKGLKFFSLKRAPTLGIGTLLEAVSAGIIPAFTFIVLRIALDQKVKSLAPISGIIKK